MALLMTCNKNKTLLDVLEVIKQNGKHVAFITDNDNTLIGILTDGDIRRLLLNGIHLQEKIEGIINKKFVYATEEDDPYNVIKMTNEEITIIPIVDKNFKYVNFYEFNRNIHIPVASPLLSGNELQYLIDAFLSTWISSSGKYIELFEKKFARFSGCKYAVAVSNGTAALHLALLALDIGEGDEVIVPDLTFPSVINVILHVKATPVIVDVEKESWCLNPIEVKKALTSRTRAIIPVHLYGQPCDMGEVMKIARKHNIKVIEDCAEAHGAKFNKKSVGSLGDIGCYSFFGNKVITTGEGGMCVTNSKKIAERIRVYKDHGQSKTKKYWQEVVGLNYRMTNLQAAIGLAQLERIDSILKERGKSETLYRKLLSNISIIEFQRNNLPKRSKITWLVSALIKKRKRDSLLRQLKKRGIDTRPFFYSLSQMPLYKRYLFSNTNSKNISKEGINFPTAEHIDKEIIKIIRETLLVFAK